MRKLIYLFIFIFFIIVLSMLPVKGETLIIGNKTHFLCGEVTAYDTIYVNNSGILQICRFTGAGTGYASINLGNNGNFTVDSGGIVNGSGAGATGGGGSTGAATQGTDGDGNTGGAATTPNNGGGGGGYRNDSSAGAGGGGGGFGGAGGKGGNTTLSSGDRAGLGGTIYGSASNQTLKMGSGGGGGSGDATAGSGGKGGAGFKVNVGRGIINIKGKIDLTGLTPAAASGTDTGGGGGGSGGHLILYGKNINISNALFNVSGGKGGNSAGTGTDDAGGGGGGGGRILYVYETIYQNNLVNISNGGAIGAGGGGEAPIIGTAGTVYYNQTTWPSDTCTYTGGNWNLLCSDNCIFSSTQTINNGNNVTITGTGTLTFNNGIKWIFTGTNQYININSGCTLVINSGGGWNY